jgi:Fur family ferric uptake transcriptional regulator
MSQDLRARWADYLATRKLRATLPRRQILDAVAGSSGHFDAETLRLRLKGEGRRLSRATIYRTLAHLQESGILRRVQLTDDALHYELSRPTDPHHHLVCRRCGSVQDVLDAEASRALAEMVRLVDFEPEEIAIRIRGLCSRCRSHERPPQRASAAK